MGAYTSTRREEDKKPDSYTWRGRKERKGGMEGQRERDGRSIRVYQRPEHDFLYLKLDAV